MKTWGDSHYVTIVKASLTVILLQHFYIVIRYIYYTYNIAYIKSHLILGYDA